MGPGQKKIAFKGGLAQIVETLAAFRLIPPTRDVSLLWRSEWTTLYETLSPVETLAPLWSCSCQLASRERFQVEKPYQHSCNGLAGMEETVARDTCKTCQIERDMAGPPSALVMRDTMAGCYRASPRSESSGSGRRTSELRCWHLDRCEIQPLVITVSLPTHGMVKLTSVGNLAMRTSCTVVECEAVGTNPLSPAEHWIPNCIGSWCFYSCWPVTYVCQQPRIAPSFRPTRRRPACVLHTSRGFFIPATTWLAWMGPAPVNPISQ